MIGMTGQKTTVGRISTSARQFLTLTPAYIGIAQAACDFTVAYLRGEVPGQKGDKRRGNAVKQHNLAEMYLRLEQTKALWFQTISEARVDPPQDMMLRAFAAQYSVMAQPVR